MIFLIILQAKGESDLHIKTAAIDEHHGNEMDISLTSHINPFGSYRDLLR